MDFCCQGLAFYIVECEPLLIILCVSRVLCVPLEFATLLWVYLSDMIKTVLILCDISCFRPSEYLLNFDK